MKKPPVCIILLCALALGGCDSPGSDEEPEEPVISPDPRTTAVSFAPTGDNSADVYFDLDAWTLEEAGEHWRIAVLEQGSVSFTVRKMAAQSIDVGGSAAAWVSQAPEGGEADGSVAGPELALFTVDTALILDGG
ncbi:MAG: hypothetical protein LBU25_07570 [Treponema sp.]|jgi:hypothetical protein|nr:hypothetical protein [Treponema sp.]